MIKWGLMDNQKSSKGIIAAILTAILVMIALVAAIIYFLKNSAPVEPTPSENAETAGDTQEDITQEPENPELAAMFEEMEKSNNRPSGWYGSFTSSGPVMEEPGLDAYISRCPDVYARIEIPGTMIDYPIAYCEDAVDPFWFTHDINGDLSDKGMIITDSLNAGDLSDTVTLIYGHSPDDGTMFAGLAGFRDSDFFKEHDVINIYLEDAQLVYRIYACYTGSSDHIFANYDFNDPIQFMSFFDSVSETRDLAMNIRESAKPVLGDHVIGLVTHCGDESKRLFVFAVLDEVRY